MPFFIWEPLKFFSVSGIIELMKGFLSALYLRRTVPALRKGKPANS